MRRVYTLCLFAVISIGITHGQNQKSNASALTMDSILKQGPEYNVIKPMVGQWKVQQTIFHKDSNKILARDSFHVERKMIGNFLQEIMTPLHKNDPNPFSRITYTNYNRTTLRWEYIVLDTRYPMMMFETSVDHRVSNDNAIHLYLDSFVVPPFWGPEFAGMIGKQHRVITFDSDLNSNRQYWTLPGGKEFMAIEYIYKKVR